MEKYLFLILGKENVIRGIVINMKSLEFFFLNKNRLEFFLTDRLEFFLNKNRQATLKFLTAMT